MDRLLQTKFIAFRYVYIANYIAPIGEYMIKNVPNGANGAPTGRSLFLCLYVTSIYRKKENKIKTVLVRWEEEAQLLLVCVWVSVVPIFSLTLTLAQKKMAIVAFLLRQWCIRSIKFQNLDLNESLRAKRQLEKDIIYRVPISLERFTVSFFLRHIKHYFPSGWKLRKQKFFKPCLGTHSDSKSHTRCSNRGFPTNTLIHCLERNQHIVRKWYSHK